MNLHSNVMLNLSIYKTEYSKYGANDRSSNKNLKQVQVDVLNLMCIILKRHAEFISASVKNEDSETSWE